MPQRSRHFVFCSFCVIAQGVRAQGIVRHYPAIVRPVIDWLVQHDYNLVQMDCPELHFDGITRSPCGKQRYDTPANRAVCRMVADAIVFRMLLIQSGGHYIDGILGVDFSPSCGVRQITGPPPQRRRPGKGIFIEELDAALRSKGLVVPMIGIQLYDIRATLQEMENLLGRRR